MRLVKRHIDRDGSGRVTLCPEDPEDMVRQHQCFSSTILLIDFDSGMLTT